MSACEFHFLAACPREDGETGAITCGNAEARGEAAFATSGTLFRHASPRHNRELSAAHRGAHIRLGKNPIFLQFNALVSIRPALIRHFTSLEAAFEAVISPESYGPKMLRKRL